MTIETDILELGEVTTQVDALPPAALGERVHAILHVLSGPHRGAMFPLDDDETTIGRGTGCQVYLVDTGISRLHARIVRQKDGFYLVDAGSRNGTLCQGTHVLEPRKLEDGDRIIIGAETVLRFMMQDRIEHEATHDTLELMNRDPLTLLVNRRHFEDRLRGEAAFARRHGTALFLVMVDLDDFKQLNKRYDKQVGDALLRRIAAGIDDAVRAEDLVARYGGEEFAVYLREVDAKGAAVFGERLRTFVEGLAVEVEGKAPAGVTASIGIAELHENMPDSTALMAAAVEALGLAQRQGRNRVVLV